MWNTVRLLPESDFELIQKGICPECGGKIQPITIKGKKRVECEDCNGTWASE